MVAAMLNKRGFKAEIIDTGGHPVVFARRNGASDKTILIYNHYDVQPAEPLSSGPHPLSSQKSVTANSLAAGSAMIKATLSAAYSRSIPCSMNMVNSPAILNLSSKGKRKSAASTCQILWRSHQELLQADACIWEFGGVDHRDIPMQYLGLRGICYVELNSLRQRIWISTPDWVARFFPTPPGDWSGL